MVKEEGLSVMTCHLKNNTKSVGYKTGDVVLSLKGHDAGDLFVIIGVDKDKGTVIVSDGKLRKTAKQKHKNIKHIKSLNIRTDVLDNCESYAADAGIRRELKRIKNLNI